MNILVTGGTGFVGINFIPALIEKGHKVRILCRDRAKAIRLLGEKCEIFVGDVTDKESLKGCCDRIDVVYHMVAKVGNELPCDEAFSAFRKVNVEGVKNIVEEARRAKVKKFISISSIAAMGIVHENVISEKSKCEPYLPYQITKKEGEQIILKEFKENGFPGIIVRPTKVYGVGEREYSYLMLAKLCKKGFFPKVGGGKNLTSNIYISDLVQGLVQLVDHGTLGETYILASDGSIGFSESAKVIAKVMGKKVHFITIPTWLMIIAANIIERTYIMLGKRPVVTKRNVQAATTDRVYSILKAKKEIGYKPEVSLEEGIECVIHYYIERKLI